MTASLWRCKRCGHEDPVLDIAKDRELALARISVVCPRCGGETLLVDRG